MNTTPKSIGFILPQESEKPIGGYKIVYEYANRFAIDGYNVFIMYLQYGDYDAQNVITKLRMLHGYLSTHKKSFPTYRWFPLHPRVKEIRILSINNLFLPKCDFYIATALKTSYKLNELKVSPTVKKYYFIQGYENWEESDEIVKESYKLPLHKIVISKWLMEIIEGCKEKAFLVPNGFDFNYFHFSKSIKERENTHIAFMYHIHPLKGISTALKAFDIVKKKHPDLKVNTFSAYPKPEKLPDWYEWFQSPNQDVHNYLYNDSAIYVGPSCVEGWGLTIGEAMICGCAVACTNNKGYLEMAKNDETALVSPVGDEEALANNILRLIEDEELRYKIASNAKLFIRQFDIDEMYQKFKRCLF